MRLGVGELLLAPHVLEEAPHAPVVDPGGETTPRSGAQRVVPARHALWLAELRQLVERVGPVVPIDEIEVRIARMIAVRSAVLRVLQAVDDGAVAAGGLAEAAAVLAARERAELAVDERNELAGDVIGVGAERGGVDVLVTAERGEAVGEDEDRRSHL